MKTIIYITLMLAITTTSYSQANTTLSNLSNPTSINQNLLPNTNNTRNLGSASKSWRMLYIDSNIYLRDSLFIHNRGIQNTFVGASAGNTATAGQNNAAFGYHTLYNNNSNSANTAVGSLALFKNKANNNTAIGYQALYSNTTATLNTAIGYQALFSNTTGSPNTAVGWGALYSNTTGIENTAVGQGSLYDNITGNYNIALGRGALFSNVSGYDNTANGFKALFYNTTGYQNTANGSQVLLSNTTGGQNTANGYQALFSNSTGDRNTASGYSALYSNTTGSYSTAYGAQSLTYNTSGQYNTGIGSIALFSNTTGSNNTATGYEALYVNTTGVGNTANGSEALNSNSTGYLNTATGYQALYSNTNGDLNVAIGNYTLYKNTIGSSNTAVGENSLTNNVSGNYITAIGCLTNVFSGNIINSTAIGNNAIVDASNKVRIGYTNITSIGGQVGWTSFSDGRYKKNIKQDVQGLAFINSLQPITYTVDVNGLNNYYDKNRKHDSSYEKMKIAMKESSDKAATIIYNGFIAQDVEKAAVKLNYNFSGVDKPQTKDGLYGLRYADFVVPLVKAVQELDKKSQELDYKTKEIDELRNEVNDLKQLVQQLIQTKSLTANDSYLSQNIPNPTNGNTIIPFQIAKGSRSASIQITQTGSGKVVKSIALDVNATQVSFNTNSLAAGSYMYSLIVDGKQVDGKQMMLSR